MKKGHGYLRLWKGVYSDEPFCVPKTYKERLMLAKQFISLTEIEECIWEFLYDKGYTLKSASDIMNERYGLTYLQMYRQEFVIWLKMSHDTVIRHIWLRIPGSKIPYKLAQKWRIGDVDIKNLDCRNAEFVAFTLDMYKQVGFKRIADITGMSENDILNVICNEKRLHPRSVPVVCNARDAWYARVEKVLTAIGVEEPE